jgi:magnesium chelatase subunit D
MSAAGDAALVASLFAVDPVGTGGVCLRSQVHPARDQWLQLLRALLPVDSPLRRIPFSIGDGRLLGGLDLVATLKAKRPVAERGVLAASDGGAVVVSMAERLAANTAAYLNSVLDSGEILLPREGVLLRHSARIGIVALDEGMSDDEFVPHSLLDRLAFLLDFSGFGRHLSLEPLYTPTQIRGARELLPRVESSPDIVVAMCATALALGAGSPRVSLLACRAARAAAALEGRTAILEEDAVVAGRLVLAPRAASVPPPQRDARQQQESEPAPQSARENSPRGNTERRPVDERPTEELESRVLAATQSAIPAGLLARIKAAPLLGRHASHGGGKAGALQKSGTRGRPAGVRSGFPRGAARLNVIETLRTAAPWQRLRGRLAGDARVRIEAADFRVTRYKQRARTLTIFVVDASGSAALNRLAEAKGAVELLLADCYIRRDQVAVISFRGRRADLLLPPTRSLLRAKRGLAGLPGGGGTPLAAAIDAAAALGLQALRRGESPTLVFLTDGRANIARNGDAGREAAQRDALCAAAAVRVAKISALFIDTSPRANAQAGELAAAMYARYVPLPFPNSRALSEMVKAAATMRP